MSQSHSNGADLLLVERRELCVQEERASERVAATVHHAREARFELCELLTYNEGVSHKMCSVGVSLSLAFSTEADMALFPPGSPLTQGGIC